MEEAVGDRRRHDGAHPRVLVGARHAVDALDARDHELDDLLASLAARAAEHRVAWYGSDLTITAFGSVFIQHESIHHGQWAAHAALGGYPTPSTWLLNWGL